MSPKPDVTEKRTEQILDAAGEVFSQKGFSDARMEDIAAKAGLSKGTLYLYFKSKESLITTLLERLFRHEMRNVHALKNAEGSASKRLERIMDAITADVHDWLRIIPVAYEFLGLIFRNRTVQKAFRQYLRMYLALITPIIQEGIDNGEFREMDAKSVAIAAGAIYEGTILLWVYDPESVNVEEHIRSGIRIILEGIKK